VTGFYINAFIYMVHQASELHTCGSRTPHVQQQATFI